VLTKQRDRSLILLVILILALPLALTSGQIVSADQTLTRTETVQLNVGDSLVLKSDRFSIQQIFLEGNLSAATVAKASQYPTNYFELNASAPGSYQLQVMFNQASDYNVNVYVRQRGTNEIGNSTAFYVSGGSFELDVNAYFNPNVTETVQAAPISAWDAFLIWMGNFGHAFPLWVKAVYLLLGVQFLIVGGLWIKRESARKEAATQPFDMGDKAYLWLDVAYKFLLASFAAIVAIMGGELIILFVLRFMFLASITLLSLWDLFVVCFAAGAVIIVYAVRFTLGKAFDLKPIEDD
jgi:hypothetical protein